MSSTYKIIQDKQIINAIIFFKKSLEFFLNFHHFTRIFKTLKVGLKYHIFFRYMLRVYITRLNFCHSRERSGSGIRYITWEMDSRLRGNDVYIST